MLADENEPFISICHPGGRLRFAGWDLEVNDKRVVQHAPRHIKLPHLNR